MSSDAGRKQFWKRNVSRVPGSIQHVYGAQHPPFDPLLHGTLTKTTQKTPTTPVKLKKVTTFQEFESNTSDAWDAGEDDDELLAMAAENLNTKVVMETANKVIQNHTKLQEQNKFQETHRLEDRPVGLEEPPSYTNSDNTIVKSASESQIPKSSGEKHSLQRQHSVPQQPEQVLLNTAGLSEREAFRLEKFKQLLAGPNTDLDELRKLSWSGIPKPVRSITWKLLSGYLPANVERRDGTLKRKQKEYFAFIEQYYNSRNDEANQSTYRQIQIDIPRMSPETLILQPVVTEIFERILFIWAIRHPASGYVQGINDLVTPFFVVFISDYVEEEEVENVDVSSLPEEVLRNIEADSYWCMSKLLDGIQDNYTFAQPGIQKKVKMLEELVSRIDEQVHRHLHHYEVEYLQFAFRWMNNLLMREVPLQCTIRLWDTYQSPRLTNGPRQSWWYSEGNQFETGVMCRLGFSVSMVKDMKIHLSFKRTSWKIAEETKSKTGRLPSEPEGFSHFHLYVCAAFLVRWRKEILEEKDFHGLLILLQNLPTVHWGNEDVSLLLAEAYRLEFAFADAPNHYKK
ncbi:TBC1 domain family member 22A isoform X2 [Mixophyes fleayi]|uniref:TBC1 domain family member 22A isoform X2 n=1 Tax=Mixophyes fleayi TaxID=3061075 RepID=UPI003F4DF1CC